MDGVNINEYYAIRNLSGRGYKLYSIVKLMTVEGKADSEGWISISRSAIANKMGISRTHVSPVIENLEKFPELIEVVRGSPKGSCVAKFRVNKSLFR